MFCLKTHFLVFSIIRNQGDRIGYRFFSLFCSLEFNTDEMDHGSKIFITRSALSSMVLPFCGFALCKFFEKNDLHIFRAPKGIEMTHLISRIMNFIFYFI